jgi:hypothetical protein
MLAFALSGWRLRSCGIIAGLAVAPALAACGSGARQDANEPKGNFPISASASWNTSQYLSQHTRLVITATNMGQRTIPNIAVTICNVTCSSSKSALANGEGSSVQAFSYKLNMPGLASQSRPVWIVDQAPDLKPTACPEIVNGYSYTGPNYSTCAGGPGGAVTAYSNTWALGSLAPGQSVTFAWHLTAVHAGTFVVHWQVAAGLAGKAKAVVAPGSTIAPQGDITVKVAQKPQTAFVNNDGKVVTKP